MLILVGAGGYLSARWSNSVLILLVATSLIGIVAGLAGSLLEIFTASRTITPNQMLTGMLISVGVYAAFATVIGLGNYLLEKWKKEEQLARKIRSE